MALLIRFSLAHQEQTRVAAQTSGAGKRALIIGGAGKMGAWFAQFLASQGFAVEIADPSEAPSAVSASRRLVERADSITISSSSRRR